MDEFLYNELNKAWKTTCKVLFKEEIGELKEYEEWLNSLIREAPSKGGFVYYPQEYEENSRFVDYKDIDFMKKFEPLNINEIKDIDSIVEALKERFVYAGNVVLGKSQFVEKSTNVFDSFYVYGSYGVEESKYIYNSTMVKDANYIFSTSVAPQSDYCLYNNTSPISKRVFASLNITSSSDVYYSSKINNSIEVMFSSGLINKSYAIGNLLLSREKYTVIKNSLIEQIRQELERNKEIFHIIDLMNELPNPDREFKKSERKAEVKNKELIENAFSRVTELVIKRELRGIDDYTKFLSKNIRCEIWEEELWRNSFISNEKTYIAAFFSISSKKDITSNRFFKFEEQKSIENSSIAEEELSKIEFNREKLKELLKNVIFISFENEIGHNINIIDSNIFYSSQNCYKGTTWIFNKNSAFCYWPRESEYVFGSAEIFNSSFAINSYYSNNIQRAFEVDNVQFSSDIYFSHNVENVINGMFCFNIKNKSYVIGNAVYSPSEYNKVKGNLLEQIADELEAKKDLKWSIYNIGAE